MSRIFRYSPTATLAAIFIMLVECVRLLLLDTVVFGDFNQAFGVFVAIAGLVGLPLCVLGAGLLSVYPLGRWAVHRAWGETMDDRVPGSQRLAWGLYSLFAIGCLMLMTHLAVLKLWGRFNNQAFLGLGVALVVGGGAPILLLLSRPITGQLAAVLSKLEPVHRPWLNPTRLTGAWVWGGGLAFLAMWAATELYHPLHNLDLRPFYLVCGWLYSLPFLARLSSMWSYRITVTLALSGTLLFVSAFFWSASSLGESQSRILTIDQRTVLAGVVLRRLESFGDSDGDGVSRWFAGGDCDDTNPDIRPGVYDAPDDGIDQNCTGSDLRLSEPVLPPPQRGSVSERKDWNVILLTIDALRADMIKQEMPRLAALARQGQVFSRAYSHGAATYWTMASLQTSKMPSRLHLDRTQTPVNSETLLAEVLRKHGWHTSLFANVTVFFVRGLRQGMNVADYKTSDFTVHGAKPGSEFLTDSLLAHIDKWRNQSLKVKRDKFFIWGHYYDPHDPYFDVPGFPSTDGGDEAKYRAICRYVDVHIGRLIDGLKERDLWDNTLLVLTADHGEEFGDHGHRFHGRTLYEEMTNVPLILHVPGQDPVDITNPVGQMEIVPTILDLLGVPIPKAYEGRSRKDELTNAGALDEEPVFLEVFPDSNYKSHQVGMVLGHLKLIYRLSDNYYELYDLESDPKERLNIVDEHPDALNLKMMLGRYVDHHLFALAQGQSGADRPPGSPPMKEKPKKKRKRRPKKKPRKKRPKASPPTKTLKTTPQVVPRGRGEHSVPTLVPQGAPLSKPPGMNAEKARGDGPGRPRQGKTLAAPAAPP